jgi:hypothetical protein
MYIILNRKIGITCFVLEIISQKFPLAENTFSAVTHGVIFVCMYLGTTDSSCEVTDYPTPTEKEIQFILNEVKNYLHPDVEGRYCTIGKCTRSALGTFKLISIS